VKIFNGDLLHKYDIGNLKPGYRQELFYNLLPTPQSIIDGTYTEALKEFRCYRDVVLIVPRLPKYLDEPSLPSITFSHDGRPGPYITDLVQAKVKLDQASDSVFLDQGWRQMSLTIDVSSFALASKKTHHCMVVALQALIYNLHLLCRQGWTPLYA